MLALKFYFARYKRCSFILTSTLVFLSQGFIKFQNVKFAQEGLCTPVDDDGCTICECWDAAVVFK